MAIRNSEATPQQIESSSTVEQILYLFLRGRWDPRALELAQELTAADDFEWKALEDLVQHQGLAPLLYHTTRGHGILPPAIEQDLRLDYYGTARRNILLFRELEGILQQLAQKDIPVILLKGAALAQTVYGNPALRPMGDIDLLVHPQDVPAALRQLATLSYRPIPPLAYRSEVFLYKGNAPGIIVELHWGLIVHPYYQQAIDADWLWQTTRPLPLGDALGLRLGPEAQVLHLCAHMLLHHGGHRGVLWLHDVAEVANCYRQQIDWDEVLARARAFNLLLSLQHVLPRVAEAWGAPIPGQTIARLRALRPSSEEQTIVAAINNAPRSRMRRLWADLMSLPDWAARVRFAWNNLFPPAGFMRYCYRIPHPLLLPFYYPYRWYLGVRSALHT